MFSPKNFFIPPKNFRSSPYIYNNTLIFDTQKFLMAFVVFTSSFGKSEKKSKNFSIWSGFFEFSPARSVLICPT